MPSVLSGLKLPPLSQPGPVQLSVPDSADLQRRKKPGSRADTYFFVFFFETVLFVFSIAVDFFAGFSSAVVPFLGFSTAVVVFF